MKKIIAILSVFIFVASAVSAQQSNTSKLQSATSGKDMVNPNIERMRIVNEKIAAQKTKAAADKLAASQNQQGPQKGTSGSTSPAPSPRLSKGTSPSKPANGTSAPAPSSTKVTR